MKVWLGWFMLKVIKTTEMAFLIASYLMYCKYWDIQTLCQTISCIDNSCKEFGVLTILCSEMLKTN